MVNRILIVSMLIMIIIIIIIIIIIFSLQSTVGKSSRRQMLQSRLAAIQKLILAHRVLKIALMNSFVLCQPTNAAARRLCRRLCRPPRRHLSQVCIILTQYSRALFGAKRELHCIYLFRGKRRSLLNPNTAQRSFFPITIFFQENLKKNWS